MALAIGGYRMTINLNSKGGGGAAQLAPDLTFPADKATTANYKIITGIDASSGLTSLISGSGKFLITLLSTSSTIAESNTAKLTIDGVVIFNSSFTADASVNPFIGSADSGNALAEPSYLVNSSFDFEYQTTTDTSIDLKYLVRPIL